MAQKKDKASVWYDGKKAQELDALCKKYLDAEAIYNNAKKEYDTLKAQIFEKAEVVKGLHQAGKYQFNYVIKDDTVAVELEKLVNLFPKVASDERIYIRTVDINTLQELYPKVAKNENIYKVTRKGTSYIQGVKAID